MNAKIRPAFAAIFKQLCNRNPAPVAEESKKPLIKDLSIENLTKK